MAVEPFWLHFWTFIFFELSVDKMDFFRYKKNQQDMLKKWQKATKKLPTSYFTWGLEATFSKKKSNTKA